MEMVFLNGVIMEVKGVISTIILLELSPLRMYHILNAGVSMVARKLRLSYIMEIVFLNGVIFAVKGVISAIILLRVVSLKTVSLHLKFWKSMVARELRLSYIMEMVFLNGVIMEVKGVISTIILLELSPLQ